MFELKRALSSAHNTSPGPENGICSKIVRHLNEDSLVSLLYLFNRIWRETGVFYSMARSIVIPILRPGKDALSYRPIALTSCLCKTLERMVNARFVYQLEKNKCIPFCFRVASVKEDPLSITSFSWKAKLETLLSGGII
ncbi:putative RNA-directed DNA polymerase from transposon X-element [Trichonephila clavipes]|nr:putative RNA-directed DNA polymerase from transposon X-element [Trichonephila clavipes]